MKLSQESREVRQALSSCAALWRARLAAGWTPPPGSAFPWAQVRLSLAALLDGMESAAVNERGGPRPFTVALILAGNTPLMAWSPLCAALLAGAERVRVKMSRDETLWPRLLVESLAEVAPDVATRFELHEFPGDDPRTAGLCRAADAVVAYGSDATIDALRAATPPGTPFFGFGHAVSVGLIGDGDAESEEVVTGFARDVLMFDQQGCLSPQVIFTSRTAHTAITFGRADGLLGALAREAELLEVPPATDPATATAIRRARDLALFSGFHVTGDPALRWTVAYSLTPADMPEPVGHGFVYVIPLDAFEDGETIVNHFGWARGRVSCVGVAGKLSDELLSALKRDGVSRVCRPGEMQTPPLDWPNGGVDLFAELSRAVGGGPTPGSR